MFEEYCLLGAFTGASMKYVFWDYNCIAMESSLIDTAV
jgi:hypothetical protein